MRYASRMVLLRAVAVALFAVPALAAQSPPPAAAIPEGRSQLRVQAGPVELDVFVHRPAKWSGRRLLMVMHGVLRNADEYRDHAAPMGDRFDALIVAPRFDAERFPSRLYQRGGILREDGSAAPRAEWTYSRLPELVAAVRSRAEAPDAKLYVIGHSAGGQFLVRCAAFAELGAERIVAANPGSVLLPTTAAPFGYGFGGLPAELASEERLRAYLAAPLTLYLGTGDDGHDEWLDASAEAMAQGSGRHQRGLTLWVTARALATQKGWSFGWRLVEAQGVAHEHADMFAHAKCEEALFGPPAAAPAAPTGKPAGK